MSVGLGLAAMVCWGVSDWILSHWGRDFSIPQALFALQLPGFAVLVGFLAWSGIEIGLTSFLLCLLVGTLVVLGYGLFYFSFQNAWIGYVSPITSAWFVVTTLIGVAWLDEQLPPAFPVCVTAILAGLYLIHAETRNGYVGAGDGESRRSAAGVVAAVLCAFVWGIGFGVLGFVQRTEANLGSVLFGVYASMIFWCLLAIGTERARHTTLAWAPGLGRGGRRWVTLAGALAFVAFLAFTRGLLYSTVVVSGFAGAYPAVTVILSVWSERRRVTPRATVSVLLIVGALVFLRVQTP